MHKAFLLALLVCGSAAVFPPFGGLAAETCISGGAGPSTKQTPDRRKLGITEEDHLEYPLIRVLGGLLDTCPTLKRGVTAIAGGCVMVVMAALGCCWFAYMVRSAVTGRH